MCSRRFAACDCWTQTFLAGNHCRETVRPTADSGKPRSFIQCEKKHERRKSTAANEAHFCDSFTWGIFFVVQKEQGRNRGTDNPKLKKTMFSCWVHRTSWCYYHFTLHHQKYHQVVALRKGKGVCEFPMALHRQQTEKGEQNVNVAPPEKNYADANVIN